MTTREALARNVGGRDLNPVWISSFTDFPREGLCRFRGKLCHFVCAFDDNGDPQGYEIFRLSLRQKLRWLRRKRRYEICVGYHWTYPNRARGESFTHRKPRWLHFLLFALHYRSLKSAYVAFFRRDDFASLAPDAGLDARSDADLPNLGQPLVEPATADESEPSARVEALDVA
jgi:hypothetical protein